MTPDELAKNNTESGHQKAVFAWCAIARLHGFVAANDPSSYSKPGWKGTSRPVEALEWIHSIPNGGERGAATAARMKAEGVKRGIPDIFLPFPNHKLHGLYIELKKLGKSNTSEEQLRFGKYAITHDYGIVIAEGWEEAVRAIEVYLT